MFAHSHVWWKNTRATGGSMWADKLVAESPRQSCKQILNVEPPKLWSIRQGRKHTSNHLRERAWWEQLGCRNKPSHGNEKTCPLLTFSQEKSLERALDEGVDCDKHGTGASFATRSYPMNSQHVILLSSDKISAYAASIPGRNAHAIWSIDLGPKGLLFNCTRANQNQAVACLKQLSPT